MKRKSSKLAQKGQEKPISLAPLSFEEAVAGMLKVKPQPGKQTRTKESRRRRKRSK